MKNVLSIQELFTARLFRVPDYQRGYAWEEQHLTDFLEDLELLPPGKNHYTGTIVLHPLTVDADSVPRDAEGTRYTLVAVVDGQQRLTSIVLLLDAIRRAVARLDGLAGLAAGIRKTYIATTSRAGQPLYRLELNRDCRDYFRDFILCTDPGPEVPTIQSHQRLRAARERFDAYLAGQCERLGAAFSSWLESLHDRIVGQLLVSLYDAETEAEVGVMFETLNNRGKQLTELEKVKNYLLYLAAKLDLPDHDLARRVNQTWTNMFERLMAAKLTDAEDEDRLLRAHWLMAYDPIAKNWAGTRSVKQRFNLRQNHAELLDQLVTYTRSLDGAALAYCDAYQPRADRAFGNLTDPHVREEVRCASEKLRRVRVIAPFLPLLIATRLKFANDGAKYRDLVRLCEVFAFRVYRLLGSRSNAGQSTLYRLGYIVFHTSLNFDALLASLRGLLIRYCPNDTFRAQFVAEPERNDWYSWGGLKYFLYEYEEYLARGDTVQLPWEAVDGADLSQTIEHILPQTPTNAYWTSRFDEHQQRRWTHDLSNLCLTTHNSSYGNKPFPEKRGTPGSDRRCYANANLFMERELASFEEWNEAALLRRRAVIVEWALARWHFEEAAATEPEEDTAADEELTE